MNPKHLVIIVPVALLIGCVGAPRRAPGSAETSAHSFGIYLVAFTADKPWGAATLGELATLPLAKEPVLSDADILSYDFASHQMLVRRGGLSRLPNPSVWGAPLSLWRTGREFIWVRLARCSPHPPRPSPRSSLTFETSQTR